MKNILLVVLTIILAGSVGVGSYFITKNLDSKEPNNDMTNNGQNSNNNIEQNNNVTVVSAYFFNGKVKYTGIQSDFGPTSDVSVNIPKIDSTKTNAVVLNQRIMDYFNDYTMLENGTRLSNVKIEYKYLIKDNYIYIYITGDVTNPGASGASYYKCYYYDAKNDVIMSSKEAFAAAGLTIDDLNKSANLDYNIRNFNICDANNINGCGCGLKIENNKLIPYYIDQCV